jgi:hypothetical protein
MAVESLGEGMTNSQVDRWLMRHGLLDEGETLAHEADFQDPCECPAFQDEGLEKRKRGQKHILLLLVLLILAVLAAFHIVL